jgi:hypothetical protein
MVRSTWWNQRYNLDELVGSALSLTKKYANSWSTLMNATFNLVASKILYQLMN